MASAGSLSGAWTSFVEIVDLWVGNCRIYRTASIGSSAIGDFFGDPSSEADRVVSIRCRLSDPHDKGRTVAIVYFASGLKIVYKPRNLGLELAFRGLLGWCKAQSPHLDLQSPAILHRGSYAWVEHIDHLPCNDAASVRRFYTRSGMLLAILHVLGATDAHFENVIARGEHPIVIDGETGLQPRARQLSPRIRLPTRDCTCWMGIANGPVTRWTTDLRRMAVVDQGGLGSAGQMHRNEWCWDAVNSDDMSLTWSQGPALPANNLPVLNRPMASEH